MGFAGKESGWSRKTPHLRMLTHFCKPSAKSQRKSPIISAEEKKYFQRFEEKFILYLFFSVHVKIASNKKLYYKYVSKEIIIQLSLLKNSCYIRSYCISSNRVLPWGYSYKCRSSRIWAISLNSCCSPTSLTATCLDGQQPL